MEYVVVSYPDDRDVVVDGQVAGKTNNTLMIEAGHHVFELGEPQDYEPLSVERAVENTTSLSPLIVRDFHPSGDEP